MITRNEGRTLKKSSHSQTKWSSDEYSCQHGLGGNDHTRIEELGMYNFAFDLPRIEIELWFLEVQAIAWMLVKWKFFMPSAEKCSNSLGHLDAQEYCRMMSTVTDDPLCVA